MNKLSDSLQLFYNWDYVEAVKTAIQAYHQTEDAIDQAKNKAFMYTYAIPIAIILAATVFVSLVTLAGRKMKQPMKNP